jgi:glycosyltransferase involved in cell wall biosynthesis
MMKIAVYAIAKNEAAHVNAFMASAKDADGVFVLDTGSTDGTVKALLAAGAKVESQVIEPWRFDTARNTALSMVPRDFDVCVILDLDEVLASGWRAALEKELAGGATRVQARYTFSWTADGKPDLVYYMDRAHIRMGYEWKGIVHEYLFWYGSYRKVGLEEKVVQSDAFQIHHHQDVQKSRAQYLPLLERACQENPENDRNAHYLGREYWYRKDYQHCITELTRHLTLKTALWQPERAASMRYIAQAFEGLGDKAHAERWMLRACAEWPEDRESWVLLGLYYSRQRNYAGGHYAALRALQITQRPLHYMTTHEAWGVLPLELAAFCAYKMGNQAAAEKLYLMALKLEPDNSRLKADFESVLKARAA